MTSRVVMLAGILLMAAGVRSYDLYARPRWDPQPLLAGFPKTLERWQGSSNVRLEADVETLLGVDEYLNRVYRAADGFPVSLYVGYYHSQRQGSAIHTPLNCLPGAGWQVASLERVPLGNPSGPPVNRVLVEKDGSRQLVYYWYQSRGRIVASDYWSKFYLVSDAITRRRSDTALVRVIAPVGPNGASEATAAARGMEFAVLAASSVRSVLFE